MIFTDQKWVQYMMSVKNRSKTFNLPSLKARNLASLNQSLLYPFVSQQMGEV